MGTKKRISSKRGRKIVNTPLNEKQELFVAELFADNQFNYTEAARKAGFPRPAQAAQHLLKNLNVTRAISERIKSLTTPLHLSAAELDGLLCRVIRMDPIELFSYDEETEELYVRDLRKVPKELRQLIQKIKTTTRYDKEGNRSVRMEIELMSKDHALNLAMKRFGMLDTRLRVTHETDGTMLVAFGTLLDAVNGTQNVIDDNIIDAKVIEYKPEETTETPTP